MYQTVLPKIVACNRLALHSSEKCTEKTRFFKMRYPNKNIKQAAHILIFINVELSRQVLELLLDHNQHAKKRVRKRGRDKERKGDVKM